MNVSPNQPPTMTPDNAIDILDGATGRIVFVMNDKGEHVPLMRGEQVMITNAIQVLRNLLEAVKKQQQPTAPIEQLPPEEPAAAGSNGVTAVTGTAPAG